MTPLEFKDLAAGISSCTTALAVVGGGLWALWRFVLTRGAHPKIEFEVDVNFVRLQGDFWIVEAIANIHNKGLVRHRSPEFTFSIRYLTASDPVKPDDRFLVCLPHRAAKGSWLPDKRDKTFVEPGVHTRYSAPARIPKDATTVLIHGKFHYENREWHTADKLLAVPSSPHT